MKRPPIPQLQMPSYVIFGMPALLFVVSLAPRIMRGRRKRIEKKIVDVVIRLTWASKTQGDEK